MEEEILEQPAKDSANVGEQITEEEMGKPEAGSTFGKFKDATSLFEAYQNLEREFTRKSQSFSRLREELDELKKSQNLAKNDEKVQENAQNTQEKEKNEGLKTQPQYSLEGWKNKVNSFLLATPDAKENLMDMAKILAADKELASLDNCLELAYKLSRAAKIRPADLDQQTIDLLSSDTRIRSRVIRDYLSSLDGAKTNLALLTGQPRAICPAPNQPRPKTLHEASTIFKKLLEQ